MNSLSDRPANQDISVLVESILVRHEGLTELLGDISFTLGGGKERSLECDDERFDIRVFMNTSITNRTRGNLTDVQLFCKELPDSPPFIGGVLGSNSIVFEGIVLPLANTKVVHCTIRNLRVNANVLADGSPIVATIWVEPHDQPATPLKTSAIVATIKNGLTTRIWSKTYGEHAPFNFGQSMGINQTLVSDPLTPYAAINLYLTFGEQYPNSFKSRAQESGIGFAVGTRLKACFNNIPTNVQIFVTTRNVPSSGFPFVGAVLVPSETDECVPEVRTINLPKGPTAEGISIKQLATVDGCASAVWEWVREDNLNSSTVREVDFGVVLATEAGTASLGWASVNLSFAPTSTVTLASGQVIYPAIRGYVKGNLCFCCTASRNNALWCNGHAPSKSHLGTVRFWFFRCIRTGSQTHFSTSSLALGLQTSNKNFAST